MQAKLNDLLLEQWFRRRTKGDIKWVTNDGRSIPINNLTDTHLENAIKRLKYNKTKEDHPSDNNWAIINGY